MEYAFDGKSFARFVGKTWNQEDIDYLEPSYVDLSFQAWVKTDEFPLKECLEGGSSLFIRVCAVRSVSGEVLKCEVQEISFLPAPISFFA